MNEQDGAQVLRINSAAGPGVAPLDEAELARLLALPNEHLVATSNTSGLAGYLLAFHRDTPYDGEEFLVFRKTFAEPYLYVDQVAVAKELQHRGIGRLMYEELESLAVGRGIRLLCCEVDLRPANARSLAFHQGLGFSSSGPLEVADGRRVALLTKGL